MKGRCRSLSSLPEYGFLGSSFFIYRVGWRAVFIRYANSNLLRQSAGTKKFGGFSEDGKCSLKNGGEYLGLIRLER